MRFVIRFLKNNPLVTRSVFITMKSCVHLPFVASSITLQAK